jgi:MFS family permease
VLGSFLGLIVANGAVSLLTLGLFVGHLTKEFGWSRGTIAIAGSLVSLMVAVTLPFAGSLMDRWGVRQILIPSILAFAGSIALLSLTPNSPTIFILLYGLVGITSAVQGVPAYSQILIGWFDRHRGLALGIAVAGTGVGTFIVPQAVRFLIEWGGWRFAYVGLACLLLIIALPSVLLFVRERADILDEKRARRLEGGGKSESGLPGASVASAIRDRRFWLLVLVVCLVSMSINGTNINLVPLLTDRGINVYHATLYLGYYGLGTITGRLVSGYLMDRFFLPYVAAAFFVLPVVGFAGLYIGVEGPLLFLAVFSLGLASGCELDLMGYALSRYFGSRNFGQLYAYLFAAFSVGISLGQFMMGRMFDALGTYDYTLVGFGLTMVVTTVLITRLGPYEYPVVSEKY